MAKRVMFFATKEDVQPLLEKVETEFSVRYYRTGMFDSPDIPAFDSFTDMPNFGISIGDWIYDPSYLVMPKDGTLKTRPVPQRKGGIHYASDQDLNKVSVRIKFGGIFSMEERILVAGQMDTVSNEKFSLELIGYFSRNLRKSFHKIGDFYVGSRAELFLKQGWRLVLDHRRPKEYDLSLG